MARNSLGDFYDPGKPLPSDATGTSTNLCLLMQGTKSLTFSILDWGVRYSTEPRNTRVPKGAVHKIVRHYSVHATTQPFSCGGKDP